MAGGSSLSLRAALRRPLRRGVGAGGAGRRDRGGLLTRSRRPATDVVHLGRPDPVPGAPVNPPILLTSTYHQGGSTAYGRDGNPTWEALEAAIGGLEGGSALTFASGLAAISALIEMLPVPGLVVVAGDAYNGTRRLLLDLAGRGRLHFRTAPADDTEATLAACTEAVESPGRAATGEGFGCRGLLWLESPSNPLLAIADLAALCEGARALGVHTVVDNTFASPLAQRPLDLGADVVVHSVTKLLAGHGDVVLGAVVTRHPGVLAGLARRRSLHGGVPGPFEAWLALRGIRTLALRLERATANAGELACRLQAHSSVARVRYPGLPAHPGHSLAARQMTGFGTVLSFEVVGPPGSDPVSFAEQVVAGTRLIAAGTSLGGVESLIERRGRWEGEEGLPPALLRLSVGIEDVEDLWADLQAALASAAGETPR